MGTVRKYNKSTQLWETISTSDANNIKVLASELIPEGCESTNIENVLQTMHLDILTLKGNVSWLAKYGGGGTGSGGSGSSDGYITVNNYNTDSSIVFEEDLKISVKSSNSNLKWEISVYGGSALLKHTAQGKSLTISKSDLDKAGLNKTFLLSISAFNSDTFTSLYWDGLIIISTVTITTDESHSFEYSTSLNNSITYKYTVGVSGNYYFKVNGYTISGTPMNLSTLSGTIYANLSELMLDDLLEETTKLQPGVNTIVAELISVDNPDIKGSFTSSVILTTEQPIIYQVTLSEDENTPTEVPVYNNAVSVDVPFNVYYSETSYLYCINCYKQNVGSWTPLDQFTWGTTYNQYNVLNSNASYYISSDNLSFGTIYKIVIKIKDVISSNEYSIDRYIQLVHPTSGLLNTRTDSAKIFEFCTFSGNISNGLWTVPSNFGSGLYVMSILNVNSRSSSIDSTNKHLRFLNASYAKVLFDTGILSNKEFTLHICYKSDYHPDQDRTILQWNDLGTPSSNGILIKNKWLYLFTNKVVLLSEKEVIDITITYKPPASQGGVGTAFIYIDGVIESVLTLSFENIVPKTKTNFYIGASYGNNDFDFSDMCLYNFALYNTCLSPYDILINRLNNLARVNLRNGSPDTDYILSGLRRNFLTEDEEGTGVKYSMLYNTSTDISFNNNNTTNDTDGLLNTYFQVNNFIDANSRKLRDTIKNYTIPIPIVYIDVSSNSQWTWLNFIAAQTLSSALQEADDINAEYYDQNLDPNSIYSLTSVSVKPQGTSTLADYIKNLDITFKEGVLFSPKETWFPEQTYTLKADIVDSSHSLNTSIGKFVNTEFGNLNDPFYPFSKTVEDTFRNDRDKEHFPKATLKHGVEGFPVLVIMNFYSKNGLLDVHSLGIYQFILGRKSPRNLGYEIITGVTDSNNNPIETPFSYPLYKEGIKLNTKTIKGYWFEYGLNESFSDNLDFQSLLDGDSVLDTINNTPLTGAFWQADSNYYDRFVDIKYSNLGTELVTSPFVFEPFKQFVENVQKLPFTVKRYSDADGFKQKTYSSGRYPKYRYALNGDGTFEWQSTGELVEMVLTADNLANIINNLNLNSISKFFVIAMLFGLLDNFQKNLPIKFFLTSEGSWEPPLLGIYDTDSGLGQNNLAEQNISESLWLCGLNNTNTDFYECKKGNNSTVVATSNKLWFLDSYDVNYAINGSANRTGSIYATQWNKLKLFFYNGLYLCGESEIKPSLSIRKFAEYFYENYFLPQTEGCGELLFNLTYIAKYITKYEDLGGNSTNQIQKLHGRRRYLIKDWLTNRVKFLDSIFDAMGILNGETNVNSLLSVSINAALGPSLEITTNAPVIVKYSNLGGTSQFIYCDANKSQSIYFGASDIDTSDYGKSHMLYNSDSIIKLGTGDNPLYDIGFSSVNTGTLPYLIEYNVSAPSRNSNNKNGLSNMLDGYMYEKFTTNNISELRTIDFRNTYPAVGATTYNLNLQNGFEKLLNLYINNSCITSLTFPQNVSLKDFNVSGSNLTSLNLESLNFIKNLDLTNCTELQTLKVTNCELLNEINIDATTSKLEKIEISSNGLNKFECNNNSVTQIDIISEQVSDINITSTSLTLLNISSNNLHRLDLSGCTLLSTLRFTMGSDLSKVETLDLQSTKIKTLSDDSDVLDLSAFTSMNNFNIKYNDLVTHIQFANVENNPIMLNNTFEACTNLQRVYGHIAPTVSNMFENCTLFSIHGDAYNGENVTTSSGVYKTCVKSESDLKTGSYILYEFLEGMSVTNLNYYYKTNLDFDFSKTSCSLFDIYYVMVALAENKNYSLRSTFYELTNKVFNWSESCDNSPSRYMFLYNQNNIVNLYRCFYNSTGNFRVFSPKRDGDSNISTLLSNYGLFTFLKSCTNFSLIFWNGNFAIDKDVFRLPDTSSFNVTEFSYFSPKLIANNIEELSYVDLTNIKISELLKTGLADLEGFGNISGFFVNLLKLENINIFLNNTLILNYDNTPWLVTATSLNKVFTSTYAVGELNLNKVFKTPGLVKLINNSFIIADDISTVTGNVLNTALFKINNDTLKQFTSLQSIGIQGSGDTSGSRLMEPFTGFRKCITGNEFPFSIISTCTNIQRFEGFFKNSYAENPAQITNIHLPGSMFVNNPNLISTSALFYNIEIPYSLTDSSFSNCPNISDVSYMFGAEDMHKNYVQGCIPYKLFYHGLSAINKTFKGINGSVTTSNEETYTKYTIINTDDGKTYYLLYSPLGNIFYRLLEETSDTTKRDVYGFNSDYHLTADSIFTTSTVTILVPNKKITNMRNCFSKCSLSAYEHKGEWKGCSNEDYSPYDYNYQNGFFSRNTAKNTNTTTYIWEYDGVNIKNDSDSNRLDDTHTPASNLIIIGTDEVQKYSTGGTLNFCCPPDLLRYCSDSATTNVTYLFYRSGATVHDVDYENYWDEIKNGTSGILDVGLEGRIPPYLLKPVTNIGDLSYMFAYCKRLSSYNKSDRTAFTIPETFFTYTPNITKLNGTFMGMVFPNNIVLNVFDNLTKLQEIHSIFKYMHIFSNKVRTTILQVFASQASKLQKVSHAFSMGTPGEKTSMIQKLRITFNNIFPNSTFTDSSEKQNCEYVFSNYYQSLDYVNFGTKTLPTSDKFNNYKANT